MSSHIRSTTTYDVITADSVTFGDGVVLPEKTTAAASAASDATGTTVKLSDGTKDVCVSDTTDSYWPLTMRPHIAGDDSTVSHTTTDKTFSGSFITSATVDTNTPGQPTTIGALAHPPARSSARYLVSTTYILGSTPDDYVRPVKNRQLDNLGAYASRGSWTMLTDDPAGFIGLATSDSSTSGVAVSRALYVILLIP